MNLFKRPAAVVTLSRLVGRRAERPGPTAVLAGVRHGSQYEAQAPEAVDGQTAHLDGSVEHQRKGD